MLFRSYGTTVIASEEAYRLAQDVVDARELDVVIVVGKTEPVRIFELLGRAGTVETGMLQVRDLYAQGLDAYRRRDWDAAEKRFRGCLDIHPHDGPSRTLLDRIARFRADAPASDWSGAHHLSEK